MSETGMSGRLTVVGLGPGRAALITPATIEALCEATDLVGYATYLDRVPPSIPVLLARGTTDDVVAAAPFTRFLRKLCASGSAITTTTYDAGHDDVPDAAQDDALAWITNRFAGTAVPAGCR